MADHPPDSVKQFRIFCTHIFLTFLRPLWSISGLNEWKYYFKVWCLVCKCIEIIPLSHQFLIWLHDVQKMYFKWFWLWTNILISVHNLYILMDILYTLQNYTPLSAIKYSDIWIHRFFDSPWAWLRSGKWSSNSLRRSSWVIES